MSWNPPTCGVTNLSGKPAPGPERPGPINELGKRLNEDHEPTGEADIKEEDRVGVSFSHDAGYLFYSDNPEQVSKTQKTGGPILSMATFKAPAQVRVFPYHSENDPDPSEDPKIENRTFRVGVFNNADDAEIRVSGMAIEPLVDLYEGHANTLNATRDMAALSVEGGTVELSTSLARRRAMDAKTQIGRGWIVVAEATLAQHTPLRLWHGIYELDITVASGTPDYAVVTYTAPDPQPEGYPTWEHWLDDPTPREVLREGLFHDAHMRLTVPETGDLPLGAGPRYFYVSTLRHADVGETHQLVLRNFVSAKDSTEKYEDTGNYGYWVDVELHAVNPADKPNWIDVWVDAVRWWSRPPAPKPPTGHLGYAGVVRLVSSTPSVRSRIVSAGGIYLIPLIYLAPNQGEYTSAFVDSFLLDGKQSVTRTYRFMHAGQTSMPFCVWLDPRPAGKRRRKP